MPWAQIATQSFGVADYGVYKFVLVTRAASDLALAVSLGFTGDATPGRLRTAFFYPLATVGGRDVLGPSEEMIVRLSGRQVALHLLDYQWLAEYSGLRSSVTQYGVAISPDRGVLPSVATLWRFTA